MSKWVKYLSVIGAVALGVLFWIITKKSPGINLKTEFRAINAEEKAKKMEAELGYRETVRQIEEEHAATMEKLDDGEKKHAQILSGDPSALAAYLVRKGR